MCKLYLSINCFDINLTTMQNYLYLCMYVLSETPFMYMHIYLISGQKIYAPVEFYFYKL